MSTHVLLNLLNELGKRDKMRGLSSILSLFRNEFNKFNNTRARMVVVYRFYCMVLFHSQMRRHMITYFQHTFHCLFNGTIITPT